MKFNFTIGFSILTLLFSLTSCEDHRIPAGQRFRLKKFAVAYENNYAYTTYEYSKDGLLAKYIEYANANDSQGRITIMSYDSQGRVIQAESQFNNTYPYRCRYSYEYDTNGNITLIKRYSVYDAITPFTSTDEEYQLSYNSSMLPITVIRSSGGLKSREQYTYSGGNIVNIEGNDYSGQSYMDTLQYDDKRNPFYGLIQRGPDIIIFNRNNSISTDKINTYDSNGLLTKSIRSTTNVGDVINTYEYEAY